MRRLISDWLDVFKGALVLCFVIYFSSEIALVVGILAVASISSILTMLILEFILK